MRFIVRDIFYVLGYNRKLKRNIILKIIRGGSMTYFLLDLSSTLPQKISPGMTGTYNSPFQFYEHQKKVTNNANHLHL
jgi:hypothetical protein